MAATLTDELTRVSVADIEKWDEADGTVYVYGRCTTPEVDTDEQVVDSGWSGPALKEYLATAPTVRVQHNPQRDPAGSAVRVDVNRDGDGAHWLKAAVDEPVAQRLVKKGHLRAFSVGIARPVVERDVTGKARGGVIKGGKIVEVSLVDSPANRSCFLEIAKSAADGTCEFTGKIGGSDDFLAKALDGDLLTKAAPEDDLVNVDLPPGASISISPADFAKLHTLKRQLVTKAAGVTAGADAEKRDIGAADRRRIAAEGNAVTGADGHVSYPIENAGDLQNAAALARSGHGDVAAARRLIARRAKELGVANPLDEGDDVKKSENDVTASVDTALAGEGVKALTAAIEKAADAPAEEQEATPDVTKDPAPKPVKKAKKKKLPPWLNKPADDDDDDKAEKCDTTPAEAGGVTASPMKPAPVGDLAETPKPDSCKAAPTPASGVAEAAPMQPVPAHREPDGAPAEAFEKDASMSDGDNEKQAGMLKAARDLAASPEVAALIRFKAAGIDTDLGRLHDLTCPAYHPGDVVKYHPYADFTTAIDLDAFRRKALEAAAGRDLEHAKAMQQVWQAAGILRRADPGMLNDFRLAAYKAFRDANPGPGTAPTPGSVSPQRFCRPAITDGHSSYSTGHDGPTTSPQVATSAPNAHSFDRPPLGAGHQSPSPSHMKWSSGEYPQQQGTPVQLSYAHMEKDQARMALVRVHDQISRQFPEVCPLDSPDSRPLRGQQPEHHPVPPIAGIGKAANPEPAPQFAAGGVVDAAPPAAAFKATPEEDGFFGDAEVYKSFKKMRKRLGKKVLSGKMTVDEARARMGRQFAQKGAEPATDAPAVPNVADIPEIRKEWEARGAQFAANGTLARWPAPPSSMDPEVIKAAVTEALRAQAVPLEAATIEAFDPSPVIEAAVTKAVTPLLEKIQAQDTKLAETQRVIDAIADQPDPSTAAFSGLAINPAQVHKSRRPAGVADQAEIAARTQDMIRRNLQHTYYNHSSPAVREAAGQELAKLGWEPSMT